jgi:hypothetical protein
MAGVQLKSVRMQREVARSLVIPGPPKAERTPQNRGKAHTLSTMAPDIGGCHPSLSLQHPQHTRIGGVAL